jgi:hypothetical protein
MSSEGGKEGGEGSRETDVLHSRYVLHYPLSSTPPLSPPFAVAFFIPLSSPCRNLSPLPQLAGQF